MLQTVLHPLPIETSDRYAQFIFGLLKLGANRPACLRHLNTLAGYETEYLVALHELRDKGKHYWALAALTDEELDEVNLDFELSHQRAIVTALEKLEAALLAVILGEAADDTLIGAEHSIEAFYYVQ